MIGLGNAWKSASHVSSLAGGRANRLFTNATPLPSLSFSSSGMVSPSLDDQERLLLVFLVILGRALADPLGHLGELASGGLLLDGLDVDLVPPVIPEVEPVAEALAHLQPERIDTGL